MLVRLRRLTPRRTLTLNNRWPNVVVFPKHTFFFLEDKEDQMHRWVRFLCEAHNRTYLWCHTVWISTPRLRKWVFKRYRGNDLMEYGTRAEYTKIVKVDKLRKITFAETKQYLAMIAAKYRGEFKWQKQKT